MTTLENAYSIICNTLWNEYRDELPDSPQRMADLLTKALGDILQ